MSTIYYGDTQIVDPRDGSTAWPWTVNVIENPDKECLQWEITGIPYTAPTVDEEFYAYFVIQGLKTQGQPEADILRLKWEVRNGPTAYVTVTDMYNENSADLNGMEEDEHKQHWDVLSWDEECTKVSSSGCDVLTVKIKKKPLSDWDDDEDVDFNAKSY